ncbi:3-dehydroquinate synthase [Gracilaria domingensis]|nr:3-dehydroquinate synthase [Gracilaria domingensis]
MDSVDWKIIPAENLIAACQQSQTELLAVVESEQEARSMFGMLQVGVDGCILRTDNIERIISFAILKSEMMDKLGGVIHNLTFATVCGLRPVNMGERVCIDTCSMLAENEGMLIGSSSQAMAVVLSEAAQTDYVPSRPFRVNAGAVHSYCMLAGGRTKYLAEICAGDEVMIVSEFGKSSRTAVVGRAKIERRPLLMIEALVEGDKGSTCTLFVQNAETVRLAVVDEYGNGSMQSVSTLQVGTRLLLKSDKKARHVGLAIDENLIEK